MILFPRSYEFCINYWPNIDSATIDNPPLFYADKILPNTKPYDRIFISPTPAQKIISVALLAIRLSPKKASIWLLKLWASSGLENIVLLVIFK